MKLLISTQELVSFSRCLYLSLSLSLSLPLPFDQSYETVEREEQKRKDNATTSNLILVLEFLYQPNPRDLNSK